MLQLPSTRQRIHFVRCPVTVHQFSNGTLGISYQGRLLARYDAAGRPLQPNPNKERTTSARVRLGQQSCPAGCNAPVWYARCFAQEGTASTFAALASSVRRYGRCCELYPDRGSHFCTTQ
jgi:hypothetical protein